jgi:hypothetical protein
MPLGILQDYKLEHVPGTAPLTELGRTNLETAADTNIGLLKHDATGQIVLVPQPSDSPNDPYNWPRWQKEMVRQYGQLRMLKRDSPRVVYNRHRVWMWLRWR